MIQSSPTYSDFSNNFDVHPVTGNLIRLIDEGSIKRAIYNLIMTNRGERFFQPLVGGSIQHFLFEPMTLVTQNNIQNAIIETITNYEPRVDNLTVTVSPDYSNDAYNISVIFTILNIPNPVLLNITLSRLR